MFLQYLAGAIAISWLSATTLASIEMRSHRYPMGGAVLFSRQNSDCPSYSDCTCEDWGMSCDLETYDWYECNDTDIAGSYDCNPPASGTGTATTSATSALTAGQSSAGTASGSTHPSGTLKSSTTSVQSLSTTAKATTTSLPPEDCPNNPADQNAPGCPTPTTATTFSCGVGSNIGAATFSPATWCGCNNGNTYPTLDPGSTSGAPCAYATPPPSSDIIHPSAIPAKSTTISQPAPSSTKKAAPSTTAIVLPTSTSHREPTEDQNCAGGPDTGSEIFSCGTNHTLFQLFAPAGTPHSKGQAKDDVGGWATYEGGGCFCINGNFCCASDASVDTDLELSFLQQINANGGGNAVAFYQDLKGQCTCNG